MDTINGARNGIRFISISEEAIQPVLPGETRHNAPNWWTELRQRDQTRIGGEPEISRMGEVDQKDAAAERRLGTLRDEQQVCGKDGGAELQQAEREQPRIGRPDPNAVASLGWNWTLDQQSARHSDRTCAFRHLRLKEKRRARPGKVGGRKLCRGQRPN